MNRTLVIGFGNVFRRDDGAGYAVLNAVRDRRRADVLAALHWTHIDLPTFELPDAESVILAAPIVLDLALLMDLAQRADLSGIQEWLSFFYKSPMYAKGLYPEHDLFIQLKKLKNTLRHMRGEDLITHLGLEYYE